MLVFWKRIVFPLLAPPQGELISFEQIAISFFLMIINAKSGFNWHGGLREEDLIEKFTPLPTMMDVKCF